jgi:hypothetical protein
MSLSRRAFLGSAALFGLSGLARGDWLEWNRDRMYRRVDELQQKFGGDIAVEGCGYLDQPEYSLEDCLLSPQTGYCPQPGDLFFSKTNSFILKCGHYISGAFQPSHSGYIFRRPDGSLATMEAGPYDVLVITAGDLIGHLAGYHGRSAVWVRPRCVPLTPEQDCRLTEFSMKQEGKPFATARIYRQMTPLKVRGCVTSEFVGQSNGPDRWAYYCAEMCTEAFIYAGLVPADCTRPPATYPYDLFYDESKVPFLKRKFKLSQYGWGVPSRWRPQVI